MLKHVLNQSSILDINCLVSNNNSPLRFKMSFIKEVKVLKKSEYTNIINEFLPGKNNPIHQTLLTTADRIGYKKEPQRGRAY